VRRNLNGRNKRRFGRGGWISRKYRLTDSLYIPSRGFGNHRFCGYTIFNASSAGDMLARKVLDSSVTLATDDTYTWTHTIVFS
jgi:hypothetical protein